ncbi:MAG TPA: hypothetical protein VMU05_19530 [Dongiaceae bacterium]|nr:hypothetical protein [Dongiaceae bacterium]
MMPMPLVAPLFIQDANFSSTLVLVNNSAKQTYADMVILDQRGDTIAKRRVVLDPYGQSQVDLDAVIKSSAAIATSGSVLVMQSPDLQGMTVAAQLLLTYGGSSQPNYLDEELEMLSADGSQMLRAVADRAIGSPLVAISSVSEMPQHIRVQCVTENGAAEAKTFVLTAGETIITEACAEGTVHGVDFAVASGTAAYGPERAVGISLTSDAMPGSFAAFALAPHGDKNSLYFSSIPFIDPMMIMSPNTVFAGVPVGSAKWLPEGTYVPKIAVANFGSRTGHIRVGYTSSPADVTPGAPQAINGTGGTMVDVANLNLAPGTAREITLDGLSGVPEMRNSFMVYSDLGPGEVIAKLVSTSDSSLHQVELLGKDEKDQENGGGHPWSLEDGTDSVLLLFNHTNKAQAYNVAIASGAILWQKLVTVPPMQTESIDIRKLITQRIKDDKGRLLPATVSSGSVSWWSPDPEHGRGRLLQANRRTAMARNFSCGYNIVLCGATYLPDIVVWALGLTSNPFGQIEGNTCTAWGPNYCSGDQYGTGGGYSYGWSSYNSGVASISGPSTNQSVDAYGAGSGTTSIMGTVESAYCQDTGGGPATVTGPVPVNFTQGTATDEGDGFIRVLYTWSSSTGKLADLGSCQVREHVTYPTSGNSACPSPNNGLMCFWPPSPPWPPTNQPGTGYVNPTDKFGPANSGGVSDDNTITNLNFTKPYSANSFPATQVFQYSCNNGSWVQFGGPFTITRAVQLNSSKWQFSISKTGVNFSSIYILP